PRGLIEALARGPLLLDAAVGTRLIASGLDLRDDDPALWNLSHSEAVADLHLRDAEAGSDAVLTNTFGANRAWLDRFGQADRVLAINRAAVSLARGAVRPGRCALGSLGPSAAGRPDALREQAEILATAAVDALFLETLSFQEAIDHALPALRGLAGPPRLVALRDADAIGPDEAHRL